MENLVKIYLNPYRTEENSDEDGNEGPMKCHYDVLILFWRQFADALQVQHFPLGTFRFAIFNCIHMLAPTLRTKTVFALELGENDLVDTGAGVDFFF